MPASPRAGREPLVWQPFAGRKCVSEVSSSQAGAASATNFSQAINDSSSAYQSAYPCLQPVQVLREPLIGGRSENSDDQKLDGSARMPLMQADGSARHARAQRGRPARSRTIRTVRGEDVALDSSSCGRTRGDCRRCRQRWLRSTREQSRCGRPVDLRRCRQR